MSQPSGTPPPSSPTPSQPGETRIFNIVPSRGTEKDWDIKDILGADIFPPIQQLQRKQQFLQLLLEELGSELQRTYGALLDGQDLTQLVQQLPTQSGYQGFLNELNLTIEADQLYQRNFVHLFGAEQPEFDSRKFLENLLPLHWAMGGGLVIGAARLDKQRQLQIFLLAIMRQQIAEELKKLALPGTNPGDLREELPGTSEQELKKNLKYNLPLLFWRSLAGATDAEKMGVFFGRLKGGNDAEKLASFVNSLGQTEQSKFGNFPTGSERERMLAFLQSLPGKGSSFWKRLIGVGDDTKKQSLSNCIATDQQDSLTPVTNAETMDTYWDGLPGRTAEAKATAFWSKIKGSTDNEKLRNFAQSLQESWPIDNLLNRLVGHLEEVKVVLDDAQAFVNYWERLLGKWDSLWECLAGETEAEKIESYWRSLQGETQAEKITRYWESLGNDSERKASYLKAQMLESEWNRLDGSTDTQKADALKETWWKVHDQKATGSSIGWALGESVLRWHFQKLGLIYPMQRLSVRYITIAAKDTDEYTFLPTTFIKPAPAALKAALDVGRKFGLLLDSGMTEAENPISDKPQVMEVYAKAARLKILSYYNLGIDLGNWLLWLKTQGPILASLNQDTVQWTRQAAGPAGGNLVFYASVTASKLGHAVAVVGFRQSDCSFIIRNSWGGGWGENGYAYVSPLYVLEAFKEAYGVVVAGARSAISANYWRMEWT